MITSQTFGDLIRALRIKNKLSLSGLSDAVELSELELKQIETHRIPTPGPYHLLKLADIFNFSFAELMLKSGCIDSYKDELKVRWVFDQLEMNQGEWIHISSVDDITEDGIWEIKKYFMI